MVTAAKKQKTGHAIGAAKDAPLAANGANGANDAIDTSGPARSTRSKLEFGALGPMADQPPSGAEPPIWEEWYATMVDWVRKVTPLALKEFSINVEDIGAALPTRIQENTSMDDAQTGVRNQLTTFRGDWKVDECLMAMKTTNMYEACGSAHWLDIKSGKVMLAGELILDEHTPWTQVQAAMHCWSWDRYMNSSEIPQSRRLFFPVTVPSACTSTADASKSVKVTVTGADGKKCVEDRPVFKNCVVLAGRAHLLAMYWTMCECMTSWADEDQTHFLKVWEAPHPSLHLATPFCHRPIPRNGGPRLFWFP